MSFDTWFWRLLLLCGFCCCVLVATLLEPHPSGVRAVLVSEVSIRMFSGFIAVVENINSVFPFIVGEHSWYEYTCSLVNGRGKIIC